MITEKEYNELIRGGLIARIGPEAFTVFSCICFCGDHSHGEIGRKVGLPQGRVTACIEALVEQGLSKYWD
jgi:DNA-binding MarR family transcriptional regulator